MDVDGVFLHLLLGWLSLVFGLGYFIFLYEYPTNGVFGVD